MLSELYAIAQSLESKGLLKEPPHPWIASFPDSEALIVEIDQSGTVTKATQISPEAKSALRNLRDGKSSFPGFNLDTPLIVADFDEWDQSQRESTLRVPQTSSAYGLKRIKDVVVGFPGTQIGPFVAGDKPEIKALSSLIDRLKNTEPKEFICGLANAIVAGRNNESVDKTLAANILFGKWSRKTRKVKKDWNPTLILEVSDLERFSHRASDAIAIEAAGAAMLLNAPRADKNIICSLSGKPDTAVGKLPNPTLRVIGQTYLMSLNKDAPCQRRYGRFGSDVYPVGYNTVLSLNGAVQLMAAEESKSGKTWTSLPASSADKKKGQKKRDLCIAYIEEAPDADVQLAGSLAREETKDPEYEWASYKQRTEDLFKAMEELPEYSKPDWHLRILILHKLDPGRTQVEFAGRYTVESLYNSYARWVKGSQNVPVIEVPYPGKKHGEVKCSSICVPYHSDAIASFKRKWIRNGTKSTGLAGG